MADAVIPSQFKRIHYHEGKMDYCWRRLDGIKSGSILIQPKGWTGGASVYFYLPSHSKIGF